MLTNNSYILWQTSWFHKNAQNSILDFILQMYKRSTKCDRFNKRIHTCKKLHKLKVIELKWNWIESHQNVLLTLMTVMDNKSLKTFSLHKLRAIDWPTKLAMINFPFISEGQIKYIMLIYNKLRTINYPSSSMNHCPFLVIATSNNPFNPKKIDPYHLNHEQK